MKAVKSEWGWYDAIRMTECSMGGLERPRLKFDSSQSLAQPSLENLEQFFDALLLRQIIPDTNTIRLDCLVGSLSLARIYTGSESLSVFSTWLTRLTYFQPPWADFEVE